MKNPKIHDYLISYYQKRMVVRPVTIVWTEIKNEPFWRFKVINKFQSRAKFIAVKFSRICPDKKFKGIGPLSGLKRSLWVYYYGPIHFFITRTVIELLHVYVRNKTEPFLFTFG